MYELSTELEPKSMTVMTTRTRHHRPGEDVEVAAVAAAVEEEGAVEAGQLQEEAGEA